MIHVGTFQSGTGVNIVADKAVIMGTTRAESRQIHELLKKRMAEMAKGTEISMGMPVKYEVLVEGPGLGAEDFACFTQKIPGFYYWLGVANTEKGITAGLHTPEFDIDERAPGGRYGPAARQYQGAG